MLRTFVLWEGNAFCSSCHLLTGPPHRRQHRAGVGLGRGLGIHGTWSGFYKSRCAVRVCDHPCQDHGGGRGEEFADSWCSMDEVRRGHTYFWFPNTFCCGRGHPEMKGFALWYVWRGTALACQDAHQKWRPNHFAGREDISYKTSEVDIYEKEMTAVHETLQGDKIQPVWRPNDRRIRWFRRRHIQKVCTSFSGSVMSASLFWWARCWCLAGQVFFLLF